MILHAKVAKLHKYLGDPGFDRIMAHIEAANDEGLESYELEVQRLDDEIKFSVIEALEAMGYDVEYYPEDETVHVAIGG